MLLILLTILVTLESSLSLPTCTESCTVCQDVFYENPSRKEVYCAMCRECTMQRRRRGCEGVSKCVDVERQAGPDNEDFENDKSTPSNAVTYPGNNNGPIQVVCQCCNCPCNTNPCGNKKKKKSQYTLYIGIEKKKCPSKVGS